MRIRKHNYHNFNHNNVKDVFEGSPIYCNDISINNQVYSVYFIKTPNTKKGYKNYLLLTKSDGKIYISGKTSTEIRPYRQVAGLNCLSCGEVIYSPHRHMMVTCACENVSVDGGSDYLKISCIDSKTYELIILDIITDTIVPKILTNYNQE